MFRDTTALPVVAAPFDSASPRSGQALVAANRHRFMAAIGPIPDPSPTRGVEPWAATTRNKVVPPGKCYGDSFDETGWH
jgi:hypothetical protein